MFTPLDVSVSDEHWTRCEQISLLCVEHVWCAEGLAPCCWQSLGIKRKCVLSLLLNEGDHERGREIKTKRKTGCSVAHTAPVAAGCSRILIIFPLVPSGSQMLDRASWLYTLCCSSRLCTSSRLIFTKGNAELGLHLFGISVRVRLGFYGTEN